MEMSLSVFLFLFSMKFLRKIKQQNDDVLDLHSVEQILYLHQGPYPGQK